MADIQVRDVFAMCNTYYPSISINDENGIEVFYKPPEVQIGKCGFLTCYVDWIYEVSWSEVRLRIH